VCIDRGAPNAERFRPKPTMHFLSRFFNLRGELFSSTLTYSLSALIKLGSSLILTRLLNPEAYGVIGILFSVAFTLELLSDVGATGLLIRHARGNQRRFVHTLWTIRLIRSVINFALLYLLAPIIARIYELPLLTDALRLFSLWFLLVGLESMAFIVAQRDQRSRIGNYVDLATTVVMTIFVVGMARVIGDYHVFIYGTLLQRVLAVIASHCFYREIGVGFAFDREAVNDQLHFGKFVLPSSLLTIVLSQYDKVVLLKLFDLTTLGLYGLAGNMIGPVAGMINHNCRVVLYPRCAEYFRTSRATAAHRYYTENARLLTVVSLPPMAIAGFSQSIVALLYDGRYQGAGLILMVLGLGSFFGSFQGTSENLLVASGRTGTVLGANVMRLLTVAPCTLAGFYFFGFQGFIWGGLLAAIPVQLYYYRAQRRDGLLDLRTEFKRFRTGLLVFAICLVISSMLVGHIPPDLLRHLLHLPSHGAH